MDATRKVLIVDTAGMGKTTLLKYLFLCCVREEAGIPIYIELRKLNKKLSILDFILEQLSDLHGRCKEELLMQLLSTGAFVFFLDGYDEIPENERAAVTPGLQSFFEKAPNNRFVLTSREETGLIAFPEFQRYIIQPLEKEEAYTLLRKYGENQLAETLIQKLKQPENAPIHEFLTNPLLTSLLYKSFEYKHIIPLKRHIFYRQVYEALYESHDLTKDGGGYLRTKRCGLDIDRFECILRALGALSYRKNKVEFAKDELLFFINDAKKLSSENKAVSSEILHDLTHAVPLMVEDGNYIRWTHKSIQEYFAAQYICRDSQGNKKDILLKYFHNDLSRHLNLITLCADIDRPCYKQSIAKEIAETLLEEFNTTYQNEFSHVLPEELTRRKELCAEKELFFVRAKVPERFRIDPSDYHKIIDIEVNPIQDEMRKQSDLSLGCSIGLENPSIARVIKKLSRDIEFLYERTELPFIQKVQFFHLIEKDPIDPEIMVHKIDDRIDSIINTPQNFSFINNLIETQCIWRFNSALAKEFLESIRNEARIKDDLNEWEV